jgi:hypothetical protein
LESVAVNKWNLSALSLVAAVPAGFLAYLMVATFLFQVQNLNWKFQVLAGATLAFSALLVLMPFGILVFARKSSGGGAAVKESKKAKKSGKAADAEGGAAAAAGSGEIDASSETVRTEAVGSGEVEAEEDAFADDLDALETEAADEDEDLFAEDDDFETVDFEEEEK